MEKALNEVQNIYQGAYLSDNGRKIIIEHDDLGDQLNIEKTGSTYFLQIVSSFGDRYRPMVCCSSDISKIIKVLAAIKEVYDN